MTQVAMFIPGIMGSELWFNDEMIWPGPVRSLILPYNNMDNLMRDDLEPRDVIRSVFISAQYKAIIDDLNTCEFRENDRPPTLVIFPYDWRKDNRTAAEMLAERIDSAVTSHRGNAEVSIIAHSMGGLIARYYMESGRFNDRPGFCKVQRLITLGTPHQGAPLALTAALGMEKRLFLSAAQVKQLVNDPRFPSLYQLLPPKGEPFAWDEKAQYQSIDIYDAKVSASLPLAAENLNASLAFRKGLDITKRPNNVRYFFFVGTTQTTLSSVMLKQDIAPFNPRKIEVDDAGDGTVPSWSGSITGMQCRPIGGEHGTIYKNDDLRRTLAVLLGKAGLLAAVTGRVEVALRDHVTNPGETVQVVLGFGSAVTELKGNLAIARAITDSDGKFNRFDEDNAARYPVSYTGATIEKMGLTFKAPRIRGAYRVSYHTAGEEDPKGFDELFVQA